MCETLRHSVIHFVEILTPTGGIGICSQDNVIMPMQLHEKYERLIWQMEKLKKYNARNIILTVVVNQNMMYMVSCV